MRRRAERLDTASLYHFCMISSVSMPASSAKSITVSGFTPLYIFHSFSLVTSTGPALKPWADGNWRSSSRRARVVRYHHQLNGHETEQTLGDSEGQRSLVCCSPWDHKSQT